MYFGARFFGPRYYGPRYFGTVVVVVVADPFGNHWYEGKTIFVLSDVSGLTEWADYLPVMEASTNPGRFDNDGAFPVVQVLETPEGLTAWADYIPVYLVVRTIPWSTEPEGYIPFEDVTS